MRSPAVSVFGDWTPGMAGNATADAFTSVPFDSCGYWLAGGIVPSVTHFCMATTSARMLHQ